jgi:signal transduction histidine kinase
LRSIVEDDGPGICEANAGHVFAPCFFATAGDSGGSGLGLAITEAIVKAHGGTISLDPAPQGARFRVIVPSC